MRLNTVEFLLSEGWEAAVRNGSQALAVAKKRLQIGRQDAIALDTLAAALGEVGQFTEAQKAAKAALGLATQAGQAALAEQISKRIELYSKSQPYREAQ